MHLCRDAIDIFRDFKKSLQRLHITARGTPSDRIRVRAQTLRFWKGWRDPFHQIANPFR
jgi:hypothetical protein